MSTPIRLICDQSPVSFHICRLLQRAEMLSTMRIVSGALAFDLSPWAQFSDFCNRPPLEPPFDNLVCLPAGITFGATLRAKDLAGQIDPECGFPEQPLTDPDEIVCEPQPGFPTYWCGAARRNLACITGVVAPPNARELRVLRENYDFVFSPQGASAQQLKSMEIQLNPDPATSQNVYELLTSLG